MRRRAEPVTPMRLAYADPPYPGMSKRLYGDHPDYAGEVDHAELIGRLCDGYPDGWALSTMGATFRGVLVACPPDVRVAIWHVTNAQPPGGRGGWHCAWEAVIVRGGRAPAAGAPAVRNVLACGSLSGFLGGAICGQKPPGFCRWVFALLGAEPGDQLDDLYPGSGAVGAEWEAYERQPWLEPGQDKPTGPARPAARAARHANAAHPPGAAVTSLLETNHRAWDALRVVYARSLPCACWRCGEMIEVGDPWHLGHVVDRALGGSDARLAPEHAGCSRSAGARLGVVIARMRLRAVAAGQVVGPPSAKRPPGSRARAARAARLEPSRDW